MTDPEPAAPAGPSPGWREVFRVCLNVLLTTITLIPVVYATIKNDVPVVVGELLLQATVVAATLTKIMQIPMVDAWLTSIGIGRAQAGHLPASPPPAVK